MRSMHLRHLLLGTALLLGSASASADSQAAAPDPFEARVQACAACHGAQGRSAAETYYPSIAGKPAGYLHQQMVNFRDGLRQNAIMRDMFAYLSDDYLYKIAEYYSRQPPATAGEAPAVAGVDLARGKQLAEQGDAALGIPACTACHGAALSGIAPAVPGLLGLRMEYLTAQMGGWQAGTRRAAAPDCMHTIAGKLSGADITAVSAWLATRPHSEKHPPLDEAPREWPLDCGSIQ